MANARSSTVHVHATEVSTDRATLHGYGATIFVVLAIIAFVALAWIAAAPSEGADLTKPQTTSADRGTQLRAADDLTGATVLVQPDPAGPSSTEAPLAVPAVR